MRIVVPALGAVSLASFVAYAVVSFPLAASQPGGSQRAFYARVAEAFGWTPSGLTFILPYALPAAIQTTAALLCVWAVSRLHGVELERARRLAFAFACAFAAVCLVTVNVLQQDSWLSVAWGRTVLRGVDPYTEPFDGADAAGIPLDEPPTMMTYGPLWGLITTVLAAVSGGSGPVAWILQKLVLLAFWIAALLLVRKLARPYGARRETTALVLVGWLPVGVHLAVAEGHNDIVMVVLLLAALVVHRTWLGPVALAGSVLTKYASAPLLPVALIYEWRTNRRGLFLRILPGALLLLAGALFLLTGNRLHETSDMQTWNFLDPADVLRLAGVPDAVAIWAMRATFGAIAVWAVVRLWRAPAKPQLIATELAVMSVTLFTVVGHVWPWFFIWVLPLAALVPRRPLSVFVLGAACVAPFTFIHYWRFTEEHIYLQLAAVAMYGTGLLALTIWYARRRTRARRLHERRTGIVARRQRQEEVTE